jgi:hypothetical protein
MGDILSEISGEGSSGSGSGFDREFGSGEGENTEEEEELIEFVEVPKDFIFIAYIMRFMAILHSIISLAMLVAYYHLKVKLYNKLQINRNLLEYIIILFESPIILFIIFILNNL